MRWGRGGWRRAAWGVGGLALLGLMFWLGRVTGPEVAPAAVEAPVGAASVWTCSMHPQVQQPEPGACPICGMDLIALEGGGHEHAHNPSQVTLSERARALARIQTAEVLPAQGPRGALRLLGRLEYDETRLRTLTAWVGGRVDRLYVATTGAKLRRGQVIAALYSPEVYAAQQDLIEARKQLGRLEGGTPLAQRAALATLESARNRLRLLGVTGSQLERMEAAEAPWRQLQISATFEGTVTERLVTEGQYVSAGAGLYKLADLSRLWVQLDAYEQDLALLAEGQEVTLTLEALPGEVFAGRVAFVDPVVDPRKRTARVRVEVDNDQGRLRPGMFAEAAVQVAVPDEVPPLVIPDSAPLFSGRRSVVYVEVPHAAKPTYEAREVRLGARRGDQYPVIAGLRYGERVVTQGAFRLDADLQIQGGQSLMMRPDDRARGALDEVIDLPEASRRRLAPLVGAYLEAQEALSADDFERARGAVERLIKEADPALLAEPARAAEVWGELCEGFSTHGRYFVRAADMDGARAAFASLTEQLRRLLATFGNPIEAPVRLAWCPMAFNNRGASWFQRAHEVSNSYFGEQMLRCGEIQDTLGAGAYLARPLGEPASSPASGPTSAPASAPSSGPASAPIENK
jgi:Cu(I)/Ag(I) efflux system membrane fusion protein